MIHCLSKLFHLPVTVQHLQDTGVGRTVNALRKYEGDTGEAAKALVAKWKAMVAAEDSSDGEEQPEAEKNNSPDEEKHVHRHEERHRSNRDKISHQQHSDSKKHREEEKQVKVKELHSQSENKKRRHEEPNRKKTEKRRRKDDVHSESSGGEDSFQVVEQEDSDSGHDSEVRSTSQVSQNVEDVSVNDGSQSPRGSVCVQDRDQGHSSKLHKSHRKHEKHKSRSKEKGHNSRDMSRISTSHEGKNKTENKGVESKLRKDEKQKTEVTVDCKERHHNDNSKKHKSKTGLHGNNNSNISELSSNSGHRDKMSTKIKKEKLSAEEEEDGSIDCSTGVYLTCLDFMIVGQVFCSLN
jgi:transcription elongation factor B polypeptide 3